MRHQRVQYEATEVGLQVCNVSRSLKSSRETWAEYTSTSAVQEAIRPTDPRSSNSLHNLYIAETVATARKSGRNVAPGEDALRVLVEEPLLTQDGPAGTCSCRRLPLAPTKRRIHDSSTPDWRFRRSLTVNRFPK